MQRLDELGRTLLAEDGEDPEGVDLFATSEAEADLSLNSSSLFFFFFFPRVELESFKDYK